MSYISKKVDWCLKKAEKEVEECKKLHKRQRHRGLIKTEPNKEEAQDHLKKAEENLKFASYLDAKEFGYKIIEGLFYCMYQCFLSIGSKFGYESGNQTCTIALIEHLKQEGKIDLDDKFIEMMKYKDEQEVKSYPSIIEMREEYTYSVKTSVQKKIIDNLTLICQELVEKTKDIVYG